MFTSIERKERKGMKSFVCVMKTDNDDDKKKCDVYEERTLRRGDRQ